MQVNTTGWQKSRFITILARTISRGFGQLFEIYHRKDSNQNQSLDNMFSPSSLIVIELVIELEETLRDDLIPKKELKVKSVDARENVDLD